MRQAAEDCIMLPEIVHKTNGFDIIGVLLLQIGQYFPAVITAAIIYKDQFVTFAYHRKTLLQTAEKFAQGTAAVINRDDYGIFYF